MTVRLAALDANSSPELIDLIDLIRSERGNRLLLLYRVLLNSPTIALGWLKLFTAIRQNSAISGKLRELVILRIAMLNGATYEFEEHVPFALREGVSQGAIDCLSQGDFPTDMSESELVGLQYADQITRVITVPDDMFSNVKKYFDQNEILELTVIAAAYNMVSRVLIALQIHSEHSVASSDEL